MTNGKGKVSQHNSAQLSSLRLKSHDGKLSQETIPTLKQALELCRGKILVFIDKAELCLPAVAKVIQETRVDDHVILYIRTRVTQAEFHQTFGPLVGTRVMFIPLIREEEGDGTAYMQTIEKFLNPPAYAIDFANESFDVAAFTARAAGYEAGVFVCTLWPPVCGGRDDEKALTNPAGTWGWFAKHGVRCMVTDQPLLLKRFLHGD
jgi:glycerophosphoryl diester phosphodiesterase